MFPGGSTGGSTAQPPSPPAVPCLDLLELRHEVFVAAQAFGAQVFAEALGEDVPGRSSSQGSQGQQLPGESPCGDGEARIARKQRSWWKFMVGWFQRWVEI